VVNINVISFGGGTNSAAMLIGLVRNETPIDLILFADTGAEHPHTYRFVEAMSAWLKERGLPEITPVRNVDRNGELLSLETECLRSRTLPSIAYGYKKCSLKHKIGPQNKFCNSHAPCRETWAKGERVVKFIGYDAGEQRRLNNAKKHDAADKKYEKHYPLMEWGWTRDDCARVIREEGLPQPGKSSCFFCPSMKQHEIVALKENYPELYERAIDLEAAALPSLTKLKGLGRNWSWAERFGAH
jgi:3'-phosphoadenosine 5'-phosphosulfate sulfotransferase (PAPS reductase)/FAD synthetase